MESRGHYDPIDALLAFYEFPAEHWIHIRSSNVIESSFATIRHRTDRTKGCLTRWDARDDLQARAIRRAQLATTARVRMGRESRRGSQVQRWDRSENGNASDRRISPAGSPPDQLAYTRFDKSSAWGAATAGWAWGPYPYWGPYAYYPRGGAYVGPYGGAAVWGPGGWAGTTGNVYHRWGSTTAVTRTSGGYNAWTGTSWRAQSGVSYNSTTGRVSAGQRGVAANAYSGNYAAGGRVTTTNPNTGNTVSAGRVTAGNAYTGQQGSAGYIKGDQGGVARVNDNLYAGHDGNVYKKTDSGWQSYSSGSWNDVQPKYEGQGNVRSTASERTGNAYQSAGRTNTESLSREADARSGGFNRAEGFQRSAGSFGGSGGGGFRGGGGRRR